ncbi:MAG: LicD family protein [Prevotella sp.]|nr:LicD family protein [Prevotella sp.]
MANYDVDKLHERILRILMAVDGTCRQRQLRYYIWAGTQLGAVRHQGFIPWDDDIDIAMPRPDYEQLIAHSREWLPQPYEFVCAENDPDYPLPFGKIQDASTTLIERTHLHYLGGIYIDVFPIDGVPGKTGTVRKSTWKTTAHFARYEYWKRVLYLIHRDPYKHGHGPSSWAPLLCRKLYTMQGVQRKIRQLLLKYDYEQSPLVADYDDGRHGAMPKEVLGTPTPYPFEDKTVLGVEHSHEYLSHKYGDYMTIPDGDHQRQHNFNVLDLDTPYKEQAKEHDHD